ncbi:M56 family metallopeptidase [Maribacter algarum]|uniref:M56 family metallopeptidase n=1 Tax=Maribacter algarum (ex Zhang et al. 2020) TaxID=2578118 RepID=A0A5S3PYH8_9FLAO|nr:M56 family metallopeptidase [Maribacter algarum]TMM58357.1 M56 family metallopeptidase [Maribacter algarum]
MLVYILKSAACLAILFVFYKLFLEKESVHKFKRFYLLVALVFSLLVPALVFTEYVEVEPPAEMTYAVPKTALVSKEVINVPPALEADVLDIEPILWGVYFMGLFFFGLKFIRNLFQIFRRIRRNPKHKLNRFTQVLLQEKITPHTFFSYIFLNKTKFESKQIPKEVLLHEETHAQQKHSWDVVFVELLQVIFWVNPFIYMAKKAIKLNHEFLADQAVLQKNIDATTYKNTLLSYLSPDSEKKYQPLANAINYSSIKKRFTIMKTQTSKKAVLLRSLLLLPLLSILIYGFSQKDIDYITTPSANFIIKDFIVEINEDGEIIYENRPISLSDMSFEVEQLYSDLTNGERNTFITAYIFYDENSVHEISEVELEIKRAGLRNVEHVSQQTAAIVNNGEINPSIFHGKTIEESRALRKEIYDAHGTIWFDIRNENEIWFEDKLIALENLAEVIEDNFNPEDELNELEVHFYSTGILRSEFVEQLNIEARKTRAKKVEVRTEEYIMKEDDYQKKIPYTSSTVRLQTNKLTFQQEAELLYVNINKKGQLLVQDELVEFNDLDSFLSKINSHLSNEQKQKNVRSNIFIEFDSPKEVIDEVFKIVSKYSDASIYPIENELKPSSEDHTARSIEIRILKDGNYLVDGIKINKNQLTTTVNTLHQDITPEIRNDIMNIHVSSSSEISKNEVWHIFNSLKDYGFYRIVSPNQEVVKGKGNTPFKIIDSEYRLLQEKDSATPNQIAEYNLLAKKYNTMLAESKSIQIKKQDVDRLEYIYGLMSDKQKADAEPFPDFPEPPPAPKVPGVLKGEVSNIPPPPPGNAPRVLKGEVGNIPPPPTPPEPQSPLDHVIEMAKKGATFYYEGKKVNSDKAIELLKKNKDLNIQSTGGNSKKPTVRISKEPIYLDRSAKPTSIETGNIEINGDEGFYSKKDGITSYFNSNGEQIDKTGKVLNKKSENNPKFFFDNKQISSEKANRLLSSNRSIQLTSKEFTDGSYALLLTDLNSSFSQDPNRNYNPNSVIDLTEMIKKDALFFYNDKPITVEKALWLTKNNRIERVNTIRPKKGKPKVYFWDQA